MSLEQKATPAAVRFSECTIVSTPRYCHARVSTGVLGSTVLVEELYAQFNAKSSRRLRKETRKSKKKHCYSRVVTRPADWVKGLSNSHGTGRVTLKNLTGRVGSGHEV